MSGVDIMKEKEKIENYEDYVQDVDEVQGTDIKINPDYYIHLSLVKLSKSFDGEFNTRESFLKYRHIVEHIEVLCDAAGFLIDEYKSKIKEYKLTSDYKDEPEAYIKNANLAREKLRLMMSHIFSSKISTDPLKA